MPLCGLNTKYVVKVWVVLALIVVDLALNTVIDSQSEKVSVLSMMGTQGVLRIVTLFIMFLFMWETFVFKYGLLGALCQRFKLLFALFPISFIFLAAVRIMRGSALFDDKSVIDIWAMENYQGLYIVHNLMSIVYYVALLQATFDLGNPSWYKPTTWLQRT